MARSDNYDLIRKALLNLDSLSAVYEGRSRVFSPHILGATDTEERVLGYQFGGESASGLSPAGSQSNFRCFRVAQLTSLELVAGTWRSPSDIGSRPGHCIHEVDVSARLSPDRDQCELDEAA